MLKKSLLVILLIIAAAAGYAFYVLQQPDIGTIPEGTSLMQIERSSHYRDGQFQ